MKVHFSEEIGMKSTRIVLTITAMLILCLAATLWAQGRAARKPSEDINA